MLHLGFQDELSAVLVLVGTRYRDTLTRGRRSTEEQRNVAHQKDPPMLTKLHAMGPAPLIMVQA